ncbi:MAG: prolipoprotein diacylglyceryl transferase [Myxococcales bacterium]|nr:prolipoprotein diacylglyceryl transferase [Myxococcales bacterium]
MAWPDADSRCWYPTQLYESWLARCCSSWRSSCGNTSAWRQVFLAFTLGYGFLRFIVEVMRDDLERGEFGPFIPVHVFLPASLLIFAAAYISGPARSWHNLKLRRATELLAIAPAVALYFRASTGQLRAVVVDAAVHLAVDRTLTE